MTEYSKVERRSLYGSFWNDTCESYYSRLKNYALKLTKGNSDDASDLVQECILRVLDASKDPSKVDNPISYILTVLKNTWINNWRRYGQYIAASLDELLETAAEKGVPSVEPSVEPVIQQTLESEEFLAVIRKNFGPLKKRERQIFKLFLLGLDCKGIAQMMNENPKVITYELNAVRSKIRYRLKKVLKAGK